MAAACVLGVYSGAPSSALANEGQQTVTPPSPTPPSPTAGTPAGAPPAAPPADLVLSDERTFTTWVHPIDEPAIYLRPDGHSRVIGRVHLETEDGFAEVYVLLVSHIDPNGRTWVKVRVPGRPNGSEGWVPRNAFGDFNQTHWLIVVNRRRKRLTAYFDGHVRMVAPVGVGKPSTPTPPGHFWIRERFRIANRSDPYWPYALGTSDYSTLSEWPGGGVVGIHGDFGQPQLIPGDPSHGCVRMRDTDIGWLAPRVTIGTPVIIE